MADRMGQQLGNYRLLRLLGQGGFADVYLAEHLYLGTQAAIKVLQTRLMSDDVEYFRIEARTIANLEHPHIVRILDFGVESNIPYLVMSYAPNGTLRQRHPRGSRLPLAAILPYVKQVAEALEYAHQQKLIHRDVKPENMLLGRQNEVLLSDFGIALIAQSSRYQATQEAAGTITYMAPEQVQGKPRIASDQYSLGIAVYEWLCGERPFRGSFTEIATQHIFTPPPPLHEKVPMIPPAVEEVVMVALAKDPQQRFKSMQAFSNALEQASRSTPTFFSPLASIPPLPPAPASPQPFSPPALRGPSPEPSSILPSMNAPSYQPSLSRDQILPQKQPSTYTDPVGEQRQSYLSVPPTTASPSHQSVLPPAPPLPARPPIINPRRGLSRIKVGMLIGLAFIVIIVSAGLFSHFSTPGTSTGTTTHFGTTATSTGTTTTNAVKGGTWIDDLFQEPDSLIPNASFETFAAMMDYGLYAPLIYSATQGQLMPGLATDVPTLANGGISQDLKTWTFHLKPGLKWSDGQPLDARDVDFTWKLWNNPKFGAMNTIAVNDIASADVSSDNQSITFHLKNPLVSFATYWADGLNAPMPAHHYSSMDPASILKSPDNLNPSVVSGPFMMSESKPTDHYTMVRNPNYYQAPNLPYLDKVVWRIVPNQNTILTDLQAGTPDSAWFLDVSKATSYKGLSNYKLVADPNTENFEALYFDFHNKVLANNREVRQAMAMAVDQQTLITVARRGLGGKLCTDHPAIQHPGGYSGPCPKFDITAANALLDQHGWVKGADGVRSKNGQRLEFQYSTTANNTWRADDELINQQNFKTIGIKLDIQNYPASTLFGTFLSDGKPGVYDIVEYETAVGLDPDDASFFQTGNPGNTTYYSNPALDALYQQEQSTADPNARQAVFDKIHQIYLTDFPFIVEFSAPDVSVHKVGTENYAPSLAGAGETVNIWEWWCDNGTCPA